MSESERSANVSIDTFALDVNFRARKGMCQALAPNHPIVREIVAAIEAGEAGTPTTLGNWGEFSYEPTGIVVGSE